MRRLIFALLYEDGKFMLSRNFRLQQAGDVHWLMRNYDFAEVSHGLDELMVIDVSRGRRNIERFIETFRHIASKCFIPMTVGGGIDNLKVAQTFIRGGADKLLLNTAFYSDADLCRHLASHFGRQCIVAGIDYARDANGEYRVRSHFGTQPASSLKEWIEHVEAHGAGEVLLQSIERDGTGTGLDLELFHRTGISTELPCILMGGVGRAEHIVAGISSPAVDAVATANLFNFIGDSFLDVRRTLEGADVQIAKWKSSDYSLLKGKFSSISRAQDPASR